MSESAVRDKPLLVYGLARNRRSPKRPSEPRPSGAHPEEDAVKRRCGATVFGVSLCGAATEQRRWEVSRGGSELARRT